MDERLLGKCGYYCGQCHDFPCERILQDPKATLLSPLWLKWMGSQRD